MNNNSDDFKKLSVEESLKRLQVDKARGLSSEEAKKRAKQYGLNEIPEKEESTLHRIFRHSLDLCF